MIAKMSLGIVNNKMNLEIWVHPRVGVVGWLATYWVIPIWVGRWVEWLGWAKDGPDHS